MNPLTETARIALAPRIAVLVPCYNEGKAIATVVRDFLAALPTATVYVYDNNSTDDTRERAAAAGAIVRTETHRGKGNVVRRMFADIEAEVYVLVDGDGTYDAASATAMVDMLLANSLDMVNGARVPTTQLAYRPGHVFGNKLLTRTVSLIFGDRIRDMLSGFRVFSRRFVKSFPALASGFETETELTVHALELRLPIAEVQTPYRDRPAGSQSKLRTFRDGWRILTTIINLMRNERPLLFFTLIGLLFIVLGVVLAMPVFLEYLDTGQVRRFPTAFLSFSLGIIAVVCFATGLILDLVAHVRREAKKLAYLSYEAPRAEKTNARASGIRRETG